MTLPRLDKRNPNGTYGRCSCKRASDFAIGDRIVVVCYPDEWGTGDRYGRIYEMVSDGKGSIMFRANMERFGESHLFYPAEIRKC